VSDPNLVTRGDVAEFFLDVGVSRLALGLALGGAEEDVEVAVTKWILSDRSA
jgi:hypothetical protein